MRDESTRWRKINETTDNEICLVTQVLKDKLRGEIDEAKRAEYEKWQDEKVYQEVVDEGQVQISTTWVITTKSVQREVFIKAN